MKTRQYAKARAAQQQAAQLGNGYFGTPAPTPTWATQSGSGQAVLTKPIAGVRPVTGVRAVAGVPRIKPFAPFHKG